MKKRSFLLENFIFIVAISIISEFLFSGINLFQFGWMSNFISFIFIIAILACLYIISFSISNSKIASIILIIFLLILSLLSKLKFHYRNTPLFFSDLKFIKELMGISSKINSSFIIKSLILYLLILSVSIFLIIKFKKNIYFTKNRYRILSFLLSFSFLIFISKYETFALSNINPNENYISGFLNSLPEINNSYSNTSSIDLSDIEIPKIQNKSTKKCSSYNPNIIIIMSEAFLDINRDFKNLYSEDIYKNFNSLKKESKYGFFESPEFGGGTSNCEFEMLTGLSTHTFKNGQMIYSEIIKNPIPSISSFLKSKDYSTIAIHPYESWFWNRENIYPLIGFDEFISMDKMDNPQYLGYYISDQYAYNIAKEKIKSIDSPVFTFIVTMQNHGPYNDNRYNNESLSINLDVSETQKKILNTYGLGIKNSDKALGNLITFLKTNGEDNVLLFFGDHFPMLDENQNLYEKLGFKESSTKVNKTYRKMYSVPFILWESKNSNSENLGYKDMIFASPILLNSIGFDMPNYFDYLYKKSKKIDFINRVFLLTKDKKLYFSGEKEYKKENAQFEKINSMTISGTPPFKDNF